MLLIYVDFGVFLVVIFGVKCNCLYHSMKGREEDDEHKSKTSQNRTHSRTNHAANPTVSDRQGQVAAIQYGKSSTPVTGKGS